MRSALLLSLVLVGCKDEATIDDSAPVAEDPCAGSAWEGVAICTAWMMNTTGETTAQLTNEDGSHPLVNVQAVSFDGAAVTVNATGLPNYTWTPTQDDIDELNARPEAPTDFEGGQTSAVAGQTYDLGDDIAFTSNGDCVTVDGYGWWPPGPTCPRDVGLAAAIPVEPTPATTDVCETALDAIGVAVNGVSIFNWWDGHYYDNGQDWQNLAPMLERYDVDPCKGHAAGVTYHQHGPPNCLSAQLEDDGSGHSPILAFMADGYPLHGKHHAAGEEAVSCWQTRDYDSAGSETGCGGGGVRDCVLVDNTDPSQGTRAVSDGPNTSDTVTSLSRNEFQAVSGIYYQDYWFDADCYAAGGPALDEHNGHDHGDYGYHYHVTDTFPFTIGPTFYGEVPAYTFTRCGGQGRP